MDFYSEYFDDYEDDSETSFDYDALYVEERNLEGVLQTCIVPSTQQVLSYIFILLGYCLLCRVLWFCCTAFLRSGEWLQHWISMLCGALALYGSVGNNFYIVLLLTLNGYVLMQALQHFKCTHIGPIVATVIVTKHILFEVILRTPEAWNNVRGIQMVATMKIISLAFDVTENRKKEMKTLKSIPTLVPYLGYVFCPATCSVGLWMPYGAYVRSMYKPASGIARSLLWTFCNVFLALVSLLLSNCIAPLLCSNRSWKWLQAYRDALVVRSSHYFISFLTQAALAVNGVNWNNNAAPNAVLGFVVSRPWTIEFPRSLPIVVRNWNLPMHEWLKTYIFRSAQEYFKGYFMPILVTFLVSSLLHGLHYQIYAVLLSLACFAYVESVLRSKLANIFDACIRASSCQKDCKFKYCDKRSHWWRGGTRVYTFYVRLVNIVFYLLSVFHLTYLGVMLSSKEEGASTFADGLSRWQKLGYVNHWVAIATFIAHSLI